MRPYTRFDYNSSTYIQTYTLKQKNIRFYNKNFR